MLREKGNSHPPGAGFGYALMAALRERHGLKGIALTGYGMEEDLSRSERAGFVLHLTKPVRMDALDRALAPLRRNGPPTA